MTANAAVSFSRARQLERAYSAGMGGEKDLMFLSLIDLDLCLYCVHIVEG